MTETLDITTALVDWLEAGYLVLKVLVGFSVIIFVHELGHFLAAKLMGIRVDRFAIGFFYRLCGYRRGEGFTLGRRPSYKPEELAAKGYGETDYCLNALPFGGYVKMLGEDDILVNEETGEVKHGDDPRAFNNKSVGRRLFVVSAGVVFNLAFAVLLYALVYQLTGKPVVAAVIGRVDVGSPAANAGLLPGDRVLSVNGKPVRSFEEILMQGVLAEGPLRLRIERGGAVLTDEKVIERTAADSDGSPLGGIWAAATTTLSKVIAANPDRRGLLPGDRITRVNGAPLESVAQLAVAFRASDGEPVQLTVERRDPHSDQVRGFTSLQPPVLRYNIDADEVNPTPRPERQHLLGMTRRLAVLQVAAGWPGVRAGFQAGDVIAQWDNVPNPVYREVTRSTDASDGRPITVVVERDGQRLTLTATPKRGFSLNRRLAPRVGLVFYEEQRHAVVADIVPDTPAAQVGMPRGAELLAVDEHPVQSWSDVFERLKAAAGTAVTIRYRTGAEELTGRMQVPSSIVNELNLPPTVRLCAIAGESLATLEDGKKVALPAPLAVQKLLEKNVGRTVAVEFAPSILEPRTQTRMFTVRADNLDPWQLRHGYYFEHPELGEHFTHMTETITAGGNPLRALAMGAQQAGNDLLGVFRIIKGMVKSALSRERGRVSVKNVSGPIGIIKTAVHQAESGYSELLFFLGYISVNLAVINLLPVPVVDGGLIIFLLLEKLRGRPLSLKVQIAATLTGLGLIVLSFALVTFQDIVKWLGGAL